MFKSEMWKIFKSTGNINAYLYYKECEKLQKDKEITVSSKERMLQGL